MKYGTKWIRKDAWIFEEVRPNPAKSQLANGPGMNDETRSMKTYVVQLLHLFESSAVNLANLRVDSL